MIQLFLPISSYMQLPTIQL